MPLSYSGVSSLPFLFFLLFSLILFCSHLINFSSSFIFPSLSSPSSYFSFHFCLFYHLISLFNSHVLTPSPYLSPQTLPALIMKIMRGIFAPIHPLYSQEMRGLLHLLLHVDAAQRPSIPQVLAQPLVFAPLLRLHTDLGMIHCASRCVCLSDMET